MTEPQLNPNISKLISLPSEKLSGGQVSQLKMHLLNACAMLGETDLYEEAVKLAKRDPRAAHDMLLAQGDDPAFEAVFPTVRVCLLADIARRIEKAETQQVVETRDLLAEVQAEACAGGPADQAREAAFRRDPARFLPGAMRSAVTLFRAPGFGMVRVDGIDVPWTYAAAGKVRSDFAELYALVEDGKFAGGILAGPAAAANELALPDEYQFVVVELSTGGRA